jgi:aspartate/methionine/tyrosine aminotransferase
MPPVTPAGKLPVNPSLAGQAPNPMFRLAALAHGRGDVLHLEFGEPGHPTPDHIMHAAVASLRDERQTYLPGNGPAWLRAAVAERVARVDGHTPTPEQIVVTAGGTGALLAALLCLCAAGDAVLLPDPGWPGYDGILAAAGASPVRYPLLPARGWLPDLDALEAAITPQTRVLLVNSPSNPGGAVFPRATVEALVAIARRHNLWLLSDECYDELIFAGAHVSPAALDAERVIAVGTCSKSYAMTGYRVGWAAAPARLAEMLGVVVGAEVNNLPLCLLRAAHAALTGPQECVAQMRASYQANRDLALDLLRAHGPVEHVPDGAFYLLVNVAPVSQRAAPAFDSIAFAEALLTARGIAVAPGGAFGATIPGHVRISLAGDAQTLRAGLEGLLEFAGAWQSAPQT